MYNSTEATMYEGINLKNIFVYLINYLSSNNYYNLWIKSFFFNKFTFLERPPNYTDPQNKRNCFGLATCFSIYFTFKNTNQNWESNFKKQRKIKNNDKILNSA